VSVCPSCGNEATSPQGRKNAKYLLIFSKPYVTAAVRSYKDKVTGLDVLRKELAKVGLDLSEFRIAFLWMHEPGKNDNCYLAGRDTVLEEAKGKEAVILVGSEASEEFCGYGAGDVAGLQVDSVSFSAPIVFVLPKPEGVFVRGAGIGELRLAVQKLGKLLND
jgi:hypothetical protein